MPNPYAISLDQIQGLQKIARALSLRRQGTRLRGDLRLIQDDQAGKSGVETQHDRPSPTR